MVAVHIRRIIRGMTKSPTPCRMEPLPASSDSHRDDSLGRSRQILKNDAGWLFPAVLAGMLVGLFHDCIRPGIVFAYRDSAHFYPPLYRLVADEWLAGRVPLWNHLLNGGQPLAGMATAGSFYLPQILLTLSLPDGTSLNLYVILHLTFAGIGAYRLAREQAFSRAASGLAAISYAFSGPVLFQIYNPIFAAGAAWLVWAVWAGWRLIHGGGILSAFLLAISLAMSVFCGDPQSGYHAGLVLGLAVFVLGLSWRRNVAALAAAAVLAGLLALVQISLATEYTRETARAMDLAPQSVWQIPEFLTRTDQSPDRANWYDIIIGRAPKIARQYRTSYGFSLAPWRVIELVWPGFSGAFHNRWTIAAGIDPAAVWVFSLYAGIGTVLLAVAGYWRTQPNRTQHFWTITAMVSLLTSVGAYGGIGVFRNLFDLVTGSWDRLGFLPGDEVGGCYWLWMTFLPGYDGFRYPSKWLTIFALATGQLAASGCDGLTDPAVRRICGRAALGIAIALSLTMAVITVVAAWVGPTNVLPTAASREPRASDLWLMLSGGLVAAVAAGGLWLTIRQAWFRPWLIVAMVAGDLVIAGRGYVVTGAYPQFMNGGNYLEELVATRPRHCRAVSPRLRIAAFGFGGSLIPASETDLFLRYLGMTMTSHATWPHGVEKIAEASTAMQADADLLFKPFAQAERSIAPRRAFDLAGVEFFIIANERSVLDDSEALALDWSDSQKQGVYGGMAPVGRPLPIIDLPLPGGDQSLPLVYVIRNESALPRARIVRKAVGVPPVSKRQWDRWIDFLKRIAFPNPEIPDLIDTVLLESTTPVDLQAPATTDSSGLPANDRCRIVVDEPQRVVIEANLTEPGVVVLADSFHPDWTLRVSSNGSPAQPRKILRANQLHRGCPLPAGKHLLEYSYHSKTFTTTAALSGFMWCLLAVIIPVLYRQSARGWMGNLR